MKLLLTLAIFFFCNIAFTSPSQKLIIESEYDLGLAAAEKEDKPVFLLFTGESCKHNKEIQEFIENDDEVNELLSNHFVNIILYVDDGTKLKEEEIIEHNGTKMTLRTKGNKWAHLERSKFNKNIQPLVVILDSKENILMEPTAFFEIQGSLKSYLKKGMEIYQD